jgi:hypothetical protein
MTPSEVLALEAHLKAELVGVQQACQQTQQDLQILQDTLTFCKTYRSLRVEGVLTQVGQLVNALLQIVDPNLKFSVEVNTETTTCTLKIEKDGVVFDPKFELGGGIVDLVAAGLRLGLWSLGSRTPLLVLDEPFRFLSRNYKPLVGELLKEIVEQLPNVHILMVTHDPDLIPPTARIYDFST